MTEHLGEFLDQTQGVQVLDITNVYVLGRNEVSVAYYEATIEGEPYYVIEVGRHTWREGVTVTGEKIDVQDAIYFMCPTKEQAFRIMEGFHPGSTKVLD